VTGRVVLVVGLAAAVSSQAHAQVTGPAPAGNATEVALRIIRENFDPPDCPSVVNAIRLRDGSIKALCSNKQTFRVFSIRPPGPTGNYAMRCSAVLKLGIDC